MEVGDRVEVKDSRGGKWKFNRRKGRIIATDKYCYTVRIDGGKEIRDVKDHFRPESS